MDTKLFLMVLVLGLVSFSCNEDDKTYITWADDSTENYFMNGVAVDADGGSVVLSLMHSPGELSVVSNSDGWVEIQLMSTDDGAIVELRVSPNDGWDERECTVLMSLFNRQVEIPVRQATKIKAEAEQKVYRISREGGEFSVKVKTNNKVCEPRTVFRVWKTIWLDIIGYEPVGTDGNEYLLHFKAEPNDDYGRMCGVQLSYMNCFTIAQEPREFKEDEEIYVDEVGELDVLLGTDKENLSRIRKLSLNGYINDIDWSALRRLCIYDLDGNIVPDERLIALDMRHVLVYDGEFSRYGELGYIPEITCRTTEDGYIPDGMFQNVTNISEIRLPAGIKVIGEYAFDNCTRITHIEIPDLVRVIKEGAFRYCRNLSEVQISDMSMLRKLGRYAFQGTGPIKFLNLPASLTDIENGNLNYAVVDMKVHWETAPVLHAYPVVQPNSVLYVPAGTADAYRSIDGWTRFSRIVEFDDDEY